MKKLLGNVLFWTFLAVSAVMLPVTLVLIYPPVFLMELGGMLKGLNYRARGPIPGMAWVARWLGVPLK